MSRRNTEATIMNYFQQEPLEKAELMLKLVKDAVRKRKPKTLVEVFKEEDKLQAAMIAAGLEKKASA